MRLPLITLGILIAISLLIGWYVWRRVRLCSRRPLWPGLILAIEVIGLLLPLATFLLPVREGGNGSLLAVMWMLFGFLSIYVPLAVFTLFDLIAHLPALFRHKKKSRSKGKKRSSRRPARLPILSVVGAAIALTVFVAMWWGALINRNNIRVNNVEIPVKQLPAALDGLRIAQISDFHLGTYGSNTRFATKVVDALLAEEPDVVVFTGDIVNRSAEELRPFTSVLGRIDAPLGVYSVMGNHDYGDYRNWDSPDERTDDIATLQRLQRQMGWEMLNNSHATLRRGADSLIIIGVENVGDPPFHTYGDLYAAYPDPEDPAVKILLSHNPAHWEMDIKDAPDKNIALTLSGHTHAMQMCVGRISPAALRYKDWGGLYHDDEGHYLYVNIGLGCVGFPARIGATPEITILTLRKD